MHIEYFKCNLIFICIVIILGYIRNNLFIHKNIFIFHVDYEFHLICGMFPSSLDVSVTPLLTHNTGFVVLCHLSNQHICLSEHGSGVALNRTPKDPGLPGIHRCSWDAKGTLRFGL